MRSLPMRVRMFARLASVLALGLVVLAGLTGSATANIRDSKERLVFGGNTYKNPDFRRPTLTINVAFRGGGGRITSSRVGRHMTDDYKGWGTRRRNFGCKRPRWIAFPSPGRGRHSFARPSMYGSTSRACTDQFHGRFWNDRRHSELWDHSTTGNFMLAQFHVDDYRGLARGGGHDVVETGDQSRRRVLRGMSDNIGDARHRVQSIWLIHPTARAGYPNSRIIGRVSLAHR